MFWTIHSARLESSLSFLRKANEFFAGNRDIAASDFLPSIRKSWLFTKDDSTLLNDRVMHVSLEEAKNGKMDWAAFVERNLPEAQKRYSAFIAALQRECPKYFASQSVIAQVR